jgi:hypothetical protein
MKNRIFKILVAVPLVPGSVATIFYLLQGGFGAGHGDFDYMIALCGLPWTFFFESFPLPEWLAEVLPASDYILLIALPVLANLFCLAALGYLVLGLWLGDRWDPAESDLKLITAEKTRLMSLEDRRKLGLCIALHVLAFLLFWPASAIPAAGGHGAYLPSGLLWGWTFLISFQVEGSPLQAFSVSVLQFMIYFAVWVWVRFTRSPVRYVLILPALHLVGCVLFLFSGDFSDWHMPATGMEAFLVVFFSIAALVLVTLYWAIYLWILRDEEADVNALQVSSPAPK